MTDELRTLKISIFLNKEEAALIDAVSRARSLPHRAITIRTLALTAAREINEKTSKPIGRPKAVEKPFAEFSLDSQNHVLADLTKGTKHFTEGMTPTQMADARAELARRREAGEPLYYWPYNDPDGSPDKPRYD